MDTQDKTGAADEGTKCCTKGKCCGCKAVAAVALLLIGGAGGYFCARHCAAKTEAPAAAPAQPQAK
ncbi:MAG: hypothetical protein ACHQ51_09735 [Elusimicrobiota bacterium]